jgi:hypothetical protein
VFHHLQPDGRIQSGRVVSCGRDPPSRGELVCAFTGEYTLEYHITHLELPATHEPLVIAPERLTVLCVSDSCLPSSLVDEVNIITPEQVLRGFIICLDTWEPMVISRERIASTPYTKKKGVSPVARIGDVRLPQSAHESSSIHCSLNAQQMHSRSGCRGPHSILEILYS